MRKSISLILAIAMIISLLPQSFVTFAGTATEAVELEFKTTFSSFNTTDMMTTSGAAASFIGYRTVEGGMIQNPALASPSYEIPAEHSKSGTAFKSMNLDATDSWEYATGRIYNGFRISSVQYFHPSFYVPYYGNTSNGYYVMLRLKVDIPGKYMLSLDSDRIASGLAPAVYFFKDDKTVTLTSYNDGYQLFKDKAPIGYHNSGDTQKSGYENVAEVNIEDGGDYFIVFFGDAHSLELSPAAADTQFLKLKGIKLTPVKDDVLTGIKIVPESCEGEVGDKISLSVNAIYSVSGEKALTSDISFRSEDEGIATVSNTGVVKCVSAGTVKITAYLDGTDFSDEAAITVLPKDSGNAGVTLKYITTTDAMADQTVYGRPRLDASGVLRDFRDIDSFEEISPDVSAPWHYAGYTGYSINMSRQFIHSSVDTAKYDTLNQPYLALKIKVSNKGDYNLWIDPSTVPDGTRAKIYIIPAEDAAPSRELIEKAEYVGEAEFAGTAGDKAPEQKVGVVSIRNRGEYYIIFDCNSDNETLLYSKYHRLILKGFKLAALPGEYGKLNLSVNGMSDGDIMPIYTEKQINLELCDSANVPLENISEENIKKTFTTSDENVATVSESGMISAVGNGSAVITAVVEYDGKKIEETFGFTVATTGRNLMEGLNHDFSGDSWVWSLPNETDEPENPKFMRTMLATDTDGNRALKYVFDGSVAAISNPPTMMLKNGIRVQGVSGGLYQLKFKFKADYKVPDGASDMALYLDLLAFTNERASTSEYLAYNSERSMNISKTADWRTLYNDWYEVTVPIAAPTLSNTDIVYLTPRIIFRPSSADLMKAGYEGEAWFDDFEIREVGYAGVDFIADGDTTSGIASTLTFVAKPYAATGDYISLGGAWSSDELVFSSDDENVIGGYSPASVFSVSDGSGMNAAKATASLKGKNASANLAAALTINGITRTGNTRIDVSGFPIKLLYASMTAEQDVIEAGSQTLLYPAGYLSDGSKADMTAVTVVYKSLTPEILAVDKDGKVSALAAGKGKIRATLLLNGDAAEIEKEITVTDTSPIVSALLSGPKTVGYLRDVQLSITGKTQNGFAADISTADIEWKVESDPIGGVTVDEKGKAFGHEYGAKAKIYAIVSLNSGIVQTEPIEIEVSKTDMRDVIIDFTSVSKASADKIKIEEYGWCVNLSETSANARKPVLNTNGLVAYTRYAGDKFSLDVDIPYSGIYQIIFTGTFSNAGASKSNIYVDGTYVGEFSFFGMDVDAEPKRLRTIDLKAGIHTITFTPTEAGPNYSYQYLKGLRFANRSEMPKIKELLAVESPLDVALGETTDAGIRIITYDDVLLPYTMKLNGDPDPYILLNCLSDTPEIAAVSADGKITGMSEGETTVHIGVSYLGENLAKDISVVVTQPASSDVALSSVDITAPYFVMSPDHDGIQLSLLGRNEKGAEIDIPAVSVSWESDKGDVCSVSDSGFVTPKGIGCAKITACFIPTDGSPLFANAIVSVREGKVSRTIYTDDMVSAAHDNISKYSWAKDIKKQAVESADKFLSLTDELWNNVPGQAIPRTITVGYKNDPDCYKCRYCGKELSETAGLYPWIVSPLSRRWKIQCPECKRIFPSNDFEKFYELGCTEENGGKFDLQTALDAHKELFGGTYGTGYLKNTLYPEVGTANSSVKLSSWESADLWGVDDSTGYNTGRIYPNGVPEIHTYIGYYNHMATWFGTRDSERFIMGAVNSLAEAYLYTGDEKYGRVGAIVLDRVADIYPDLDLRPYSPQLANTNGGSPAGKSVGRIWETYVTEELARAYDMLFPMYDDPQVVDYLSEKAAKYNIANKFDSDGNVTPETIRKNIENGVCREIYKASLDCSNYGNFGLHQLSMTLAAVALDNHPDTDEMLDWVFRYSKSDGKSINTGGGINSTLVSHVTRDGQGDESPQYNLLWVTQLIDIATTLARYKEYDGMALFDNPKYIGMIKSYAPLTLLKRGLAPIGDSGFAVHFSPMPNTSVLLEAYKYTKDAEIAQHLYTLQNGDLSELHYDIFTEEPESIKTQVENVIKQNGEYNYDKSSMLTGFGFAALRAGTLHKASGADGIYDTMRDFTVYFGGGKSHSHNDMLNLGVDAYGIGMTTDLGYPEVPSATNPNRLQWINPTISHNTVVVNELSQNKTGEVKKPLHFDATDTRVKVMDVEAPEAYGACDEYRRTVVMVDYDSEVSYGIDFFRILGGDDHLYSFHANSDEHPKTSNNLTFEKQIGGTYAGASVPFGDDPYTNTSVPYTVTKYPLGYTWLFDVYRSDNPAVKNFFIDYKIKDFRGHSRNPNTDIHLRMTMVNDFEADEVTLASGLPTRIKNNSIIDHLEYMLVRRKGKNLDTLFTTVIEPYNKSRYIKENGIKRVDIEPNEAVDESSARAAAVKVELVDGRTDYIVYAQDNSKTYTVTDEENGYSFRFRGFVGVWTLNSDGVNTYSYVNDGEMIGDDRVSVDGLESAVCGTVVDFQDELSFDNWIEVEFDHALTQEEADNLTNRMISIVRREPGNSAFMIKGVTMRDDTHGIIDLGIITTIAGFKDDENEKLGYEYDVSVGKRFEIPMSHEANPAPVFDNISNITANAGRSISVKVNASSENDITYSPRQLPNGSNFNAETGTFSWKPEASQIGDNLVAIDATDAYGRLSTLYFTVKVYGATTPSGEGSSGGGGGGTPTPTPEPEPIPTPDPTQNPEPTPGEDEGGFIDIDNYAWAKDSINSLAKDGVIKGTSEDTFSPGDNITRADFAILLVRAFKLTGEGKENFADVDTNDYFAHELAIAKENGIVGGIGDNKYAPRETITREDMMVIVYRALTALGMIDETNAERNDTQVVPYEDFDSVADYAKDAVSYLIANGLVNGKNGLIDPKAYTTRAEVAVLVKRILEFTAKA